jgi:hypothetical protein
MSINVIDNFEVGVSKPIDNRFVVGPSLYYTNRDFISYKYTGLRIWDLNDNLPYVWTGATWSNETTSGTVNGSGTSGYISKFVGSSPTSTIGNSVIFESGGNVGIGTTTFGSPTAKLQVTGRIRTTVGFYGDGFNITGIDGAKIVNSTITLNKIANSTPAGRFLVSGVSSPEFASQNDIVLSSSRIGIGNNAPSYKLDVSATASTYASRIINNDSAGSGLLLNASNTSTVSSLLLCSSGSPSLITRFYVRNDGVVYLPNNAAANSAPDSKLWIGGSDSSDTVLYAQLTHNNAYTAKIFNESTTATGGGGLWVRGKVNSSNSNLLIIQRDSTSLFYVKGDGRSYINRLSVGTTTDAPTDGLIVKGNIVLAPSSSFSSISTTGVHLDFEGPTSGTSVVNPRFFRETNTSGAKAVSFHRGNGTFQEDAKIGVGTSTTLFGAGGGNVILVEHNSANSVYIGSGASTGQNGVLQVTSKNFGIAIDGASFKAVNNTSHIINFVNAAGTIRGQIKGDGANTVIYQTSSDLRLKSDIIEMESMIEKIKMLKPSNYKWKEDDANGFGFIAQEVYNVFPELRPTISSYCDTDCKDFDLDNPVDKNGNPYHYGLDYGQFTPFLTKALQEVIYNYEDLIDKIKNSDSLDDLKNSL